MFSAPPIPRPTQTIRSALSRSTPSSLGGATGSMNVVRRSSSSVGGASVARSPRPGAAGSSVSAAELIANTAGRAVRTVAWSCPP